MAVLVFPGSNDDRDAAWALGALGAEPVLVWHDEHTLPAGTPGPAMRSGMPADSSYIVDLPHRPRVPRLSPWSLE